MRKVCIISIFMIMIVSYSCKKKNKDLIYYHSNGKISRLTKFNDDKDSSNVTLFEYKVDGKLHGIVDFKNGVKNGKSLTYDENGNVKFKYNYLDGKQHGVQSVYENNKIQATGLKLKGKDLCVQFYESDSNSSYRVLCYDAFDSLRYRGQYLIDSLGDVVLETSGYYHTFGQDTVCYKSSVECVVAFRNKVSGSKFELQLGDVDSFGNLINPSDAKIYKTLTDSISFIFKPKHKGENLILGRLTLELDGKTSNFIYYHDLYVE